MHQLFKSHESYIAAVAFIALALLIILQANRISETEARAEEVSVAIQDLQEDQERIHAEIRKQWDDIRQQQGMSQEILRSVSEIQERVTFKPRDDIALSVELQEVVFNACIERNVPYELVLAMGYNESGWEWPGVTIDANGLPSVGYMGINEPAWDYLLDRYGYYVHDERENILGGIALFAELLGRYDTEKALVCYECGENGAIGISSTQYSRRMLEQAADLSII